ncbi:MAG: hypothetical protein AAFX99_34155, partial [Myxococcota bacterium]
MASDTGGGDSGDVAADAPEEDSADEDTVALDGSQDVDDPSSGMLTLSHGVDVVVGEDGAVSLRLGDRVLASWNAEPVTTLTYEETFTGPLAIWEFERSNEREVGYSRDRVVRMEGDTAVVSWSGAGGVQARMRFEPRVAEKATRIEVTVEGGADYRAMALAFACGERSTFYGWGEQYNQLDQRGEAFELLVTEQGIGREEGGVKLIGGDAHTTYFPMPWWMDLEGGFGVLVETPYR